MKKTKEFFADTIFMKRLIFCVVLVLSILACSACGEAGNEHTIKEATTLAEETFTETTLINEDTSEESSSPTTTSEETAAFEAESEATTLDEETFSETTLINEDTSEESSSPTTTSEETTAFETESETVVSYSFEELFSISEHITVEKLSNFTIDRAIYAADGPILHDFMGSDDQDLIDSIIDFINNVRFTEGKSLTPDLSENTITLYAEEDSFEFCYNTNNEFLINGTVYIPSTKFPQQGRYNVGYYYIEVREELKLSSYGTVTTLTDFDLSEIHLIPIYIETIGPDLTKDADLIVDGKTFQIRDAETICCNSWGYFRVTSEKNFSSLIPEGETSSMIRLDHEYSGASYYAFVSNNVIYTLEELRALVDSRATKILNSDGTEYTDRVFTGNEVLTVQFAYNYGSTFSYAGSIDEESIYKNAVNSDKFPLNSLTEYYLPLYKLDTLEDLEQFKATFGDKIDFDMGWDEVPSFNDVTGEYDEGFFEEYTLLLIYVHSGSSSYRYKNLLPQTDLANLNLYIGKANDPEVLEDLEASWFITVAYPDEYLEEFSKIIVKLSRNSY